MQDTVTAETASETKRGRVRRLLIDPLVYDGMRFKKGTDPDVEVKYLNRVADALSYLNDRALVVLRESLSTKGEGAARCFWPSYLTVIALAEAFQPRALEDTPGLRSWFASEAGRAARDADRLVAEFLFWQSRKRPPLSDREREHIRLQAADMASRASRINDRLRRGLDPFPGDGDWLHWYNEMQARALNLVEGAA